MRTIRMLEDRDGSPNHTHVHTYRAGEVYSEDSEPRVSAELMAGFVASGHAVEVDAQGNPTGKPVDRRALKAAQEAAAAATPNADATEDGEDTGYNSPREQKMRRSR